MVSKARNVSHSLSPSQTGTSQKNFKTGSHQSESVYLCEFCSIHMHVRKHLNSSLLLGVNEPLTIAMERFAHLSALNNTYPSTALSVNIVFLPLPPHSPSSKAVFTLSDCESKSDIACESESDIA